MCETRASGPPANSTLIGMLTPVGLGQTRLILPGLVPDARGVVAGRELCARFATLDRLVWFFRLLSAERPPDELWLGLRIIHARSGLGLREVVVLLPNPPGQAADTVARAARSAGGQCFTGAGRHYVQYRDSRGPFGYDVSIPSDDPVDLTLYAADGSTGYRVEGEMPFDRLLYGLELRRLPGALQAVVPAGPGSLVYVSARRGLGPRLAMHLLRAGVHAEATVCEPSRPSAFELGGAFWLLRIEELPPRLTSLLWATPGLMPFAAVLDNLLVAAGYRHPIHLESCRALFGDGRLFLFRPPPAPVTVLPAPSRWTAVADLLPLRVPVATEAAPAQSHPAAPPVFDVPVRLERASTRPPRVVGAWIPWREVPWLRRLCYALPPAALRGYQVALLEPAVLVLGGGDLAGLPFGQLLDEAAPAILVPVGMRLSPQLAPERLAQRWALAEGSYVVFPAPDAAPLRVNRQQLEPLERRILSQARLEPERVGSARRLFAPSDDAAAPDVVHDSLGPWPLWGLRK
jgi:hypothetical protein